MEGKRSKPGRPKVKVGYENTTVWAKRDVLDEWKEMCDARGWTYGERWTQFMVEDLARNKPKQDITCPVCGRPCLNTATLREHGERHHKGVDVLLLWYKKKQAS